MAVSLAAWMKRREVTMCLMPAAVQAASMAVCPAEKFSMAGTRPKAWRAKKVAALPAALGSSRRRFRLPP